MTRIIVATMKRVAVVTIRLFFLLRQYTSSGFQAGIILWTKDFSFDREKKR
jgi:hypothetical protein